MEIIERREQWEQEFQEGWLKQLQETGEMNWGIYTRPKNEVAPAGKAIELSQSKLMFISSAGGYLRDSQAPFNDNDDTHPLGDYTIRVIPSDSDLDDIAIAHSHYPHDNINKDRQVQIPLRHLEEMVAEGKIGSLTRSFISYAGYQPVATRVEDELLPAIKEVVAAERPNVVLLVPSWPSCTQSVGLIARGLQMAGYETVVTTWNAGIGRMANPPRMTITRLERGATLGAPGDKAQQRRVLDATLALLAQDAPLAPVTLQERLPE